MVDNTLYSIKLERYNCDLRDIIHEFSLPFSEKLKLFFEIAKGVHDLHENHIYHLDLKPMNIVVGKHDDRFAISIIDFGSSMFLTDKLTQHVNPIYGSPTYVPPEIRLHGLFQTTIRYNKLDIWTLGLIGLELFGNKTQILNKTTQYNTKNKYDDIEQLYNIVLDPESLQNIRKPFNLSSYVKNIDEHPDLKALLENMLNYDVSYRFDITQVMTKLEDMFQMKCEKISNLPSRLHMDINDFKTPVMKKIIECILNVASSKIIEFRVVTGAIDILYLLNKKLMFEKIENIRIEWTASTILYLAYCVFDVYVIHKHNWSYVDIELAAKFVKTLHYHIIYINDWDIMNLKLYEQEQLHNHDCNSYNDIRQILYIVFMLHIQLCIPYTVDEIIKCVFEQFSNVKTIEPLTPSIENFQSNKHVLFNVYPEDEYEWLISYDNILKKYSLTKSLNLSNSRSVLDVFGTFEEF